MSSIILQADTASDVIPDLASSPNIRLVPIHVSMGNVPLDDGAFPAEEIHTYCSPVTAVPAFTAS
jgi:hypothetical protein